MCCRDRRAELLDEMFILETKASIYLESISYCYLVCLLVSSLRHVHLSRHNMCSDDRHRSR
jgi:hypothetical protein